MPPAACRPPPPFEAVWQPLLVSYTSIHICQHTDSVGGMDLALPEEVQAQLQGFEVRARPQ